jgi:hypothetical protein
VHPHLFSALLAASVGASAFDAAALPVIGTAADTTNRIHKQTLEVDVTPGGGIHVVDTLVVTIGTPAGLRTKLDHSAQITSVTLNGSPAPFTLVGGVFHVQSPPRTNATLVVDYKLPQAPGSIDSSGTHLAGAYHSVLFWHPGLSLNSPNDQAKFKITVRIPDAFRVTTTLPQTETVSGGTRTVIGTSPRPELGVSVIYDRGWQVTNAAHNGLKFETFLTPSFRWAPDTLFAAMAKVMDVLGSRFGQAIPPYLAIVEDRPLGPNVNRFTMRLADGVFSGPLGPPLLINKTQPGYTLGHEIAHGWTINGTGLAGNWLKEGWAQHGVDEVLAALYGPTARQNSYESHRNVYEVLHEGQDNIFGDSLDFQVDYAKGPWVLRMLEQRIGAPAFAKGIKSFVARQVAQKPAGYKELLADMSSAAGCDVTPFVFPWLNSKYEPNVDATKHGTILGAWLLTQGQPEDTFTELPLDLELRYADGSTARKSVVMTQRTLVVNVGSGVAPVVDIRIDPDHKMLVKRHWGDTVTFTLPVSQAPGANTVQLLGDDWSATLLQATKVGADWVVRVPMTEGRYIYRWLANQQSIIGDPNVYLEKVVGAVHRITGAHPRP